MGRAERLAIRTHAQLHGVFRSEDFAIEARAVWSLAYAAVGEAAHAALDIRVWNATYVPVATRVMSGPCDAVEDVLTGRLLVHREGFS